MHSPHTLFACFFLVGFSPSIAAPSTITGAIDVRPSWGIGSSDPRLENEAALKYAFSPKVSLGYVQEFWTTGPSSNGPGSFNMLPKDGYVRTDVTPFAEWRVYLPTDELERSRGFLSSLRNYLKLHLPLSPRLQLTIMEVPIVYAYQGRGQTIDGVSMANRLFENRVYLTPSVSAFENRLTVSLPIIFQAERYQEFQASAQFDNRWRYLLWIYPEMIFAIDPTTALGLAYYSENLIADDLSKLSVSEGLRSGIFQLVFQKTI